jgi:hypothetical protein
VGDFKSPLLDCGRVHLSSSLSLNSADRFKPHRNLSGGGVGSSSGGLGFAGEGVGVDDFRFDSSFFAFFVLDSFFFFFELLVASSGFAGTMMRR